jgi:hypothetical protein
MSNGTAQSPRSTVLNHLVSDVYTLLAHGPESWLRLEDGAIALMPRYPFHHALRLRLQEVAERALSISTNRLPRFEGLVEFHDFSLKRTSG